MHRRTLLAVLGATSAGLAAGCLSRAREHQIESPPPTSTPPSGRPTTGSPRNGSDDDPQIVGSAIETVDASCLGASGPGVDVSFGDERIVIDGVAQAATPCHEAVIDSAVVEMNDVILHVGFERVGEECVECIGAISYEAILDMTGIDSVDSVTVIHGENGERSTHPRRQTDSGTTSPTDQQSPPSTVSASQQPDPDVDVILVNEHDTAHQYSVTIRRESGAIVYAATHEVPASGERQIYNLIEADPDGIEAFTISSIVGGQEEAITVRTNACYGNAIIEVTAAGELYPYYSIC